MRLLSHDGVEGAERCDEKCELGNVRDQFKEILTKGLGRGDDRVVIVETELGAVESSHRAVEASREHREVYGLFASFLQCSD